MNASIVDLRYKTKQILAALDRRETVKLLYRGKTKGFIQPADSQKGAGKASDHKMFGCIAGEEAGVAEQMNALRGKRY